MTPRMWYYSVGGGQTGPISEENLIQLSQSGQLGRNTMVWTQGLRVIDIDGRRISFGRATGRHVSKVLSALLLFVGYLMITWTEKKQALHDKMAGTLVLRQR